MASFFLIWGEVYARVRLEVGLRWFVHPSVVLSAVPCFCAQLFRNGSWVFCLCIFQSRICPKGAFTQLFLVPYSFFVFCIWRRDGSRCKFCNKGFQVPGLSQTQCQTRVQVVSCASNQLAGEEGCQDPLLRRDSFVRAAHKTQGDSFLKCYWFIIEQRSLNYGF